MVEQTTGQNYRFSCWRADCFSSIRHLKGRKRTTDGEVDCAGLLPGFFPNLLTAGLPWYLAMKVRFIVQHQRDRTTWA
jgi:hypothetical protein